MKTIFSFVAVCLVAALVGCQTTNPTVAPGAVRDCGAKCGQACTKDKSECCGSKDCNRADLGAVSDCGSACTKAKSECTGAKAGCHHNKAEDASLGAVSEKSDCSKSDCHHKKSDCQKAEEPALGAVSETAPCGAKRSCGAAKSGCSR